MTSLDEDDTEFAVEYPRFDHGEDLTVRWCRDGTIEFRTGVSGERIAAEEPVRLADAR